MEQITVLAGELQKGNLGITWVVRAAKAWLQPESLLESLGMSLASLGLLPPSGTLGFIRGSPYGKTWPHPGSPDKEASASSMEPLQRSLVLIMATLAGKQRSLGLVWAALAGKPKLESHSLSHRVPAGKPQPCSPVWEDVIKFRELQLGYLGLTREPHLGSLGSAGQQYSEASASAQQPRP